MEGDENEEYIFKILIVGESGVGKSCLLLRYSENKFMPNHIATVGVDFKSKVVFLDDREIKLKLWDTAGQERFHNITQQYYKGAQGIVIVFDLNEHGSFEKVTTWYEEIHSKIKNASIVLIGNKSDKNTRQVKKEEIDDLIKTLKIPYFEVSALSNAGIEEAFESLVSTLTKRADQGEFRNARKSKKMKELEKMEGSKNKKCGC